MNNAIRFVFILKGQCITNCSFECHIAAVESIRESCNIRNCASLLCYSSVLLFCASPELVLLYAAQFLWEFVTTILLNCTSKKAHKKLRKLKCTQKLFARIICHILLLFSFCCIKLSNS
jgi:hypothetical protein